MASELLTPPALSVRRSRVQPDGGAIATELGVTPIAAVMKSFSMAAAGRAMLMLVPDGRSAKMCVLPTSALPPTVAVLTPVAPAAACATRAPSSDWPLALLGAGVATSNDSVMPAGGVQVRDDANVCALTTIVFATVVVTLGVACDVPLAVACPFCTSIGVVVSTPEKLWIPPT